MRNNDTNGVIKFTLRPTSYDWQFIPIAGETFTDSGSAICVGAGNVPTPTNTPVPPTPTNTPTPVGTPSALDTLYISSSSGGTVGGVTFADEDILAYNLHNETWRKVFDGSIFGLGAVDVDAFDFLADGSLLLSFDLTVTLPGSVRLTINDIAKFTPSQAGNYSAGSFSMFLDGSDVGLLGADENIDAIAIASDGRLVISVMGAFIDGGLSVKDEDLVIFNGQTGSNSSGTWSFFFDGGDLGLSNASEDVRGVWLSPTRDLYLNTLGDYYLQGVITGDENDIFICSPGILGSRTECDRSVFWDGATHGFTGEQIDDFSLADSRQLAAAALENDPTDAEVDDSVSLDIDEDHEDGNESGSDDINGVIYLPFVNY